MRTIIIAGFVIALASGIFLNYAGHPWQVLAQTQGTQNATQGSSSAGGGSAAAGGNQTGGNQTGGGGKSTTPPSTVETVKGGPKAAGSASQLQQIEGPNAGASSAGQNATSAAQGQNNTNPLAKIPIIGKLFGGQ